MARRQTVRSPDSLLVIPSVFFFPDLWSSGARVERLKCLARLVCLRFLGDDIAQRSPSSMRG